MSDMIICQAESITRHYTGLPVFEDVSFSIQSGDRIGLVGLNGAGKSTLLAVLARIDPPDNGRVHFHPDATIGVLEQIPEFEPGQTLLGEVKKAMAHLEAWHEQMIEAGLNMAHGDEVERRRWARRYDELQELLRIHGGFDFSHRIDEVLLGLGFAESDYHRPLATFSGGQQNRVLLAKLLLNTPDLMLLDEPTNHLDIETSEWLEQYLNRQEISMIIVSHDRYFLDQTVNKVFELHRGRLSIYPGNYGQYLKEREERQKVLDRAATKQQVAIEHHEEFIRRNKAGQLSKQAKAREKMLARLEGELVERIDSIQGPRMRFAGAARTGDIVLAVRNLRKGFDETLFENVSFEIARGERVGLVGANGTGKTTLLRIILGELQPDSGEVRIGHNVKVGYLDQQLETLDPNLTPLDVVRPPWRAAEGSEPFRAALALFGIGPDLAENRIGSLSGGERTRVALTKIYMFEYNLLILDEPTNHLDIWACESLEHAVREFTGTVLIVSHDRYFLNQVADRILYLSDKKLKDIKGNYDELVRWKSQIAPTQESVSKPEPARDESNVAPQTSRRKRQFPFRKTSEIEREIAEVEQRIQELEAQLGTPEVYQDGRKVAQIAVEMDGARLRLEQLYQHWEEAVELNPSG